MRKLLLFRKAKESLKLCDLTARLFVQYLTICKKLKHAQTFERVVARHRLMYFVNLVLDAVSISCPLRVFEVVSLKRSCHMIWPFLLVVTFRVQPWLDEKKKKKIFKLFEIQK